MFYLEGIILKFSDKYFLENVENRLFLAEEFDF